MLNYLLWHALPYCQALVYNFELLPNLFSFCILPQFVLQLCSGAAPGLANFETRLHDLQMDKQTS